MLLPLTPLQARVLVVDDDPNVCTLVVDLLHKAGFQHVHKQTSPQGGCDQITSTPYDLVLLDLKMPDVEDGLSLLSLVVECRPEPACVVLSSVRDLSVAIRTVQLGALDYVLKPVDNEKLLASAFRALSIRSEGGRWRGVEQPEAFEGLVAESPRMVSIFRYLERAASGTHPILFAGPSGSGKESLARAVHKLANPMGKFRAVRVEGEGLDSVLELQEQPQVTLFLDEIADLALREQVQLLRAVEGADDPQRARLLLASSRDLEARLQDGLFRADLYYPLSPGTVVVPGLAERGEDVPAIAQAFVERYGRECGRSVREISPRTLEALKRCPWPGNVRELQHVIREAVLQETTAQLRPSSLPPPYRVGTEDAPGSQERTDHLSLAELEQAHILRVLQAEEGNITHAARVLGISRVTLHRKLKGYRKD